MLNVSYAASYCFYSHIVLRLCISIDLFSRCGAKFSFFPIILYITGMTYIHTSDIKN